VSSNLVHTRLQTPAWFPREGHSRIFCSSPIQYNFRDSVIVIQHPNSCLFAGHFLACAFCQQPSVDVLVLKILQYLKVAVFSHDVSAECFVVFQHSAVAKPLNCRHRLSSNLACEVPCFASPVVDKGRLIG